MGGGHMERQGIKNKDLYKEKLASSGTRSKRSMHSNMTDLGASLQKDVDRHWGQCHVMKLGLLRHCLGIPVGRPLPLSQRNEEGLDAVKASSLSLCRVLSPSLSMRIHRHMCLDKCRLADCSCIVLCQCCVSGLFSTKT